MTHHQTTKIIGNVLIALGLIVLLGVGGCLGLREYQGEQLRARLRESPPAPATVAPTVAPASPTPTALSPSATPAATAMSAAPTLAASPTITAAAFPAAGASPTVQATATPLAATSAPPPTAPATAPALPIVLNPAVRIVILDLKINAAVVEMGWRVVNTASGPISEWVIPENEAGHHINSALPGEPGNIVISGHNNIFGRVFEAISLAWDDARRQKVDDNTDRSDILDGRPIQLYDAAGRRFDYTITEFYRLRDTGVSLAQRIENGRFMQPTNDQRLTLVTCWPITSNTHRLIVIARPAGQ